MRRHTPILIFRLPLLLLLLSTLSSSVFLCVQSASAQPAPTNRVPPGQPPTNQAPPGVAPPEAGREPEKAAFAPRTFLVTTGGQVIGLHSIFYAGASITARDVANRNHAYPLAEIAAIISPPTFASLNAAPAAPPPAPAPEGAANPAASSRHGVLTLIDGERLPGRLLLDSGRGDSVAWESPVLGRILYPLSRIAEIRFDTFAPTTNNNGNNAGAPGAAGGAAAPDQSLDPLIAPPTDILDLANADRMAGFVRSITTEITIDPGAGAAPIQIPTDRVARILFSGPREPDSGPLAWLKGGEIIRIRGVRATNLDARILSLELPSARVLTMNPDALLALTLNRAVLVPLSTLKTEEDRSLNDQWRPDPMRAIDCASPTPFAAIRAQDLELSGPKFIRWKLPPGARLLVGGASLPQKAWEFGDCTFSVWQSRRPILQAVLNKDKPDMPFALPLAEDDLTITLAPGAAGPGQAYTLLREPLIVVVRP